MTSDGVDGNRVAAVLMVAAMRKLPAATVDGFLADASEEDQAAVRAHMADIEANPLPYVHTPGY